MTDSDLRDRLQEFPQIGAARADEIITLVREHDADGDRDVDLEHVRGKLDDALDYHQAGDPSYGMKFVRQARSYLEGLEAGDADA